VDAPPDVLLDVVQVTPTQSGGVDSQHDVWHHNKWIVICVRMLWA
jgi:hypothetical protein